MGLVRQIVFGICGLIWAASAAANPVHTVRFTQTPIVMLWQGETLIGQGTNLSLFAAQTDVSTAVLGSGDLDPLPVSIPANQSQQRFKIASNSGFVIETAAPASVKPTVRVVEIAPNAQHVGSPVEGSGQVVFQQNAKTALHQGTAESQTLTIEIAWEGDRPPALRLRAL